MSKHILVVEDDTSLARLLTDNLVYEGFTVDCVDNGVDAIRRARTVRPDMVLLDLMIPQLNGFEVCRTLSATRDHIPIIVLTARSNEQDKIRGLGLGADDYITKPFSLQELLARIQAVLRRTQRMVESIQFEDVVVDFRRMTATKRSQPILLTNRELALLQYLAEREGKVVSREELLRAVWGYDEPPLTRTVDIFVGRLRRKIEDNPQVPRFIRTMHGEGYSLVLKD